MTGTQTLQCTAPPDCWFQCRFLALFLCYPWTSPDTVDHSSLESHSSKLPHSSILDSSSWYWLLFFLSYSKFGISWSIPLLFLPIIHTNHFSAPALWGHLADSSINSRFLSRWCLAGWGDSIPGPREGSSLGECDAFSLPFGQLLCLF